MQRRTAVMHINARVRYFRRLKQVILAHIDQAPGASVLVYQVLALVVKELGECDVNLFARVPRQMFKHRVSFVEVLLSEQIPNALPDSVRVHGNERLRIRVVVYFQCSAFVGACTLILAPRLIIADKRKRAVSHHVVGQLRSVCQHLTNRDVKPVVPLNNFLAEFGLVNVEQTIHRVFFQNAAHLPNLRGLRFGHTVHVQVGRFHIGSGSQRRAVQKQLHVARHKRQVGMTAVAHSPSHDLLNAVHVVPRLHDVHLAHVLEVNAFAARLGNNYHLDALPVLVFGGQRLQLGAIVGRQLLVAREHGVFGSEPFFCDSMLLHALRYRGRFEQRPHLRVVSCEPHFF